MNVVGEIEHSTCTNTYKYRWRSYVDAHNTRIATKPPITDNINHAMPAELPLVITSVAATNPSGSQPRLEVCVNADNGDSDSKSSYYN